MPFARLPSLICLLFASALTGQTIQQGYTALGSIDWTARSLRVVGTARTSVDSLTPAIHYAIIQRAKQDAYAKLIRLIGRVRINGAEIAATRLAQDPAIAAALASQASRYTIDEVRQLGRDGVSVAILLGLDNGISQTLMPREAQDSKIMVPTQPLCPICGQPWPPDLPTPLGRKLIVPPGGIGTDDVVFTGLVVDARGLNLVPALAPRIFDARGNPVYDQTFAERDQAVARGLVTYVRHERDLNRERVGENPYRVRALMGFGAYYSDIIISPEDAGIILGTAAHLNLLRACRVSILVD